MQMRGAGPVSAPAWGLLPAVLAVAVTGCTMCPDPYDYSGPVPNGSPPQNDFRARSNGILPIGGTPQPWPTIVKKSPAATRGPHVIARGEVKQLSAEKQVADKEEPSAEQAVSEVPAFPPIQTQNTVAVIGESEEVEAGSEEAAETSQDDPAAGDVPAEPGSDSTDASETDADAAVSEEDETNPATEQAASPGSVAPQLPPEPPATGDSTAGESAEGPETDESAAEPAAVDPPPAAAPIPTPLLRESPGWRPRRPLSPGLFAP